MSTSVTPLVAQPIVSGSPRAFPKPGFWCVVAGALGVIAGVGHAGTAIVEQPDPAKAGKTQTVRRDVLVPDAPSAEVHFVDVAAGDSHGETVRVKKNVPFDDIRIATLDEIRALDRASHVTELQARRLGYPLSDAQSAAADQQEKAELEQQAEAATIAAHPEAIAAEEEIAAETREFVERIAAKRTAIAAKIVAESTKS